MEKKPSGRDRSPAKTQAVRERVRARWQNLLPLAVVAAAPLLNAACDPAPEPYCAADGNRDWVDTLEVSARWVAAGGSFQIEVTVHVTTYDLSINESEFAVTGGTLDSVDPDLGIRTYVLLVTPDASNDVQVSGAVDCDGGPGRFDVVLSDLGSPSDGATIAASIE